MSDRLDNFIGQAGQLTHPMTQTERAERAEAILAVLYREAREHARVWHGPVPNRERQGVPLRPFLNAIDMAGELLKGSPFAPREFLNREKRKQAAKKVREAQDRMDREMYSAATPEPTEIDGNEAAAREVMERVDSGSRP